MYLIFDCETSGLPDFKKPADAPGQPRMCSIAAKLINDSGAECGALHALIRPDGWDDEVKSKARQAFAVNGLSYEKLMDEGRSMVGVLAELVEMENNCTGIAAYGIAFDMKMLRGERRRLNINDRYGFRPDFCVLQGSRKLHKFPKTPTLGDVHLAFFDEELQGAHDALNDLNATVRVFNYLRKAGVVEWKQRVPA